MRRRPPPSRRPLRRAGARRVPPALRRANNLMESGDYAEAALAFEKIAQRAEARRGPRAPLFHLRAGKAFILAENVDKGMSHLRQGLGIMIKKGHWEPLQRFGQRTVDELNELGLEEEAGEIATLLAKKLPEKEFAAQKTSRPALPTQCPHCGAPLRSDEVMWIDTRDAECAFCGNPVRGED